MKNEFFKLDCEVFNIANLYDEAGKRHNELLSEIENNGNAEMNLDEVFQLSDEIISKEYGKELVSGFSSKAFATPIIDFESYEAMQNFIKNLKINDIEKSLNLELFDFMMNYDGNNVCDIIDSIKKFEEKAIAENRVENVANTLVTSSVARYSLAYWNDRVQGGESLMRKGFWKKLFIGVADAIGAAAGAVAGSATVIGGIAGGIVGGSAASAGFAKAWDLFAE
ncbi:MAG: hypothetical protein Q4F57_07310 [Weeksellaceae bacterium]|nr:hypothetical protein [Weeksellaceae bacterium]